MPAKRKVLKEDFELLQKMHVKLHHLKEVLIPNTQTPLFSTDFTASGLIGLVLGRDAEVSVDVDTRVFFNDLDTKLKKQMLTEYKTIAKQMLMRIVDYDVSIPGRDENFDIIPDVEGPEEAPTEVIYEDEDGNQVNEDGTPKE